MYNARAGYAIVLLIKLFGLATFSLLVVYLLKGPCICSHDVIHGVYFQCSECFLFAKISSYMYRKPATVHYFNTP